MSSSKAKSSRVLFRDFLSDCGLLGQRKKQREFERDSLRDQDEEHEGSASKEKREKKSKGSCLVRYIGEFRDQKARLILVLVMGVIGTIMQAMFPWSSKLMIDFVLPRRDMTLLVSCCLLLLFIGLGNMLLTGIRDYTTNSLLGNFSVGIKRRMMRRLQQMPLNRLHDMKIGGLISSLQSDTEHLSHLLQQGLLTPFNSILTFAVGLLSLILIAWEVTLVSVLFCLFVGSIAFFMFNVMRPFYKGLRRDRAEISGRLTEVFTGVEVVRAFSQQNAEARGFSVGSHYLWRKSLYGSAVHMMIHRLIWMSFWLVRIAIWAFGGYHVIQGKLTLGDLMAFMALTQWLFQPIMQFMNSVSQLQTSVACAERVFELLDEPVDEVDQPDAQRVRKMKEGLTFENVTFSYPDGTKALEDVELTIPRGKVTALVGPSGAGKSSITNLVMRFYEVTEGRICIDGVDIRDTRLTDYRRLISLVLQDVMLFDGTLRENIAYGRPDATEEEVIQAAKIANCHEFVSEMEDGYDSIIGERGVKLSGGQKQRISLARAVLVDPQILILDEATSNLDTESEALIQDALENIFEGRTTIVIAHRLSTIMDADKIVVLEKGQIMEEGTHAELLNKKGRYFEMYAKQMRKDEDEGVFAWDEKKNDEKDEERSLVEA